MTRDQDHTEGKAPVPRRDDGFPAVRPFQPYGASSLIALLGFGLGLCLFLPFLGLRSDAATLGRFWLWGPTAASVAVGVFLLASALRTTVPGNLPAATMLGFGAAFAIALHLAAYLATHAHSPLAPVPGEGMRVGLRCFAMEVALGVPTAILLFRFARRGLTASPVVSCTIGALGAAVVADAVWRLFCKYSAPGHVLASHSIGIGAVVAIGCLLGLYRQRKAANQWRVADEA